MKALILMTRVPVPGCTKTRLMEILSGDECAELHKCFLLDLFHVFEFIKDDMDIFLTYTPKESFSQMAYLVPSFIHCFPQEGKDLGEKMHHAFQYVFNRGYGKVVLIGADIPDIQPYEIGDAFDRLAAGDVVLGPTFDGGYYLIGMKNSIKELFHNKLKWGNKSVLEGTMDIANSLGLKLQLTCKHRDIDTKEDFIALKNRIDSGDFDDKIPPVHTIDFINKVWSDGEHVQRYIQR